MTKSYFTLVSFCNKHFLSFLSLIENTLSKCVCCSLLQFQWKLHVWKDNSRKKLVASEFHNAGKITLLWNGYVELSARIDTECLMSSCSPRCDTDF